MKRVSMIALLAALLLAVGPSIARAQEPTKASSAGDEAWRLFDDAAGKLVRLAEAIPAEKYTWRPGEGVRSVSEVFLHVAAGNYSIPRRLGAPPPEGFDPKGYETSTTDKAKVIEALKASIEHVHKAYTSVSDLDKTAPWFGGRQATMREIMFFLDTHEHEHLGQMIAYARINGIVPPWTAEAQKRRQGQ